MPRTAKPEVKPEANDAAEAELVGEPVEGEPPADAEAEPAVDEAAFLETIGEPETAELEPAKTDKAEIKTVVRGPKADETAPGGAYVVNGVLVNANGEAI